MVLLDVVNGMDVVFNIKDTIMLVGGIVSLATAYLTLKFSFNAHRDSTQVKFENMQKEFNKELETLKVENTSSKMGRHAIRKELKSELKEKIDIANLRIDKTQEDMKNHKTEVQGEFKEINMSLNKIVGMLEAQQKK